MFPDKRFELGIVESPTCHHERGGFLEARRQRCDDVVDVVFDIDAGLRLELLLPLLVHRHRLFQARAQIRVHDGANIGVSHHRGVGRHVPQLIRNGRG